MLLRRSDVDDSVQRVFIEAFRSIARFRGESKFSTWLHGIAYRVALKALRTQKRRAHTMDAFAQLPSDPGIGTEEAAIRRERSRQVLSVLDHVRPKRQLAFTLYYLEDLPIQEVAERMGVSVDNAWVRVRRARADVIKQLEKKGLAR